MNLKLFSGPNDENERVIVNLKRIEIEFARNTFNVDYLDPTGKMVHEEGELNTLYKGDTIPSFLFDGKTVQSESGVGTFVDPTTVSTAAITASAKPKTEEQLRTERERVESPKASEVSKGGTTTSASAVGTLTNPTTVETKSISEDKTKEGPEIVVPSARTMTQAPVPEIKKK